MTRPQDPHLALAIEDTRPDQEHPSSGAGPRPEARHATAAPAWWQRKPVLLGLAVAVVVGAFGAGAHRVAAQPPAVYRQGNGMVSIDLSRVTGVYHGRAVTLEQVEDLNKAGKAMVSVASRELACQGVMLYFDTHTEADEYEDGFLQRQKQRNGEPGKDPGGDPCQGYDNVPDFRPSPTGTARSAGAAALSHP